MAFKRINQIYFLADSKEDLKDIPVKKMGTECFVIEDACEYKQKSDGTWVKQMKDVSASESTDIDLSNYVTKEECERALAHLKETTRPVAYEITNVPEGTIVDYRDKEIRVFCTDGVEWKKQQVGANGDPNMYYMTFRAYAPAEAASFKEGDRGVIIDETHDFNGPASGIDAYGRKYSVCWLALAKYDEASDTWTYFGATSNTSKYIGWTYCVEWYNADGKMIGTDKIRINLSNKDCHLDLAPYYG